MYRKVIETVNNLWHYPNDIKIEEFSNKCSICKRTVYRGYWNLSLVFLYRKMAKLASVVEKFHLYTYRFACSYDKGQDVDEASSIYKFQKDQIVRDFVDLTMEILGSYGQLKTGAKDAPKVLPFNIKSKLVKKA